jgi:NAD(P)-dependent dehydrogenase (short-subunit alcohol dehydrogenase family)
MGRLDGKVIIVTGASYGLGRATAVRLAEEGAQLAICARSLDLLEEAATTCRAGGVEVFAAKVDLSKPDEMESFVDRVGDVFGRIDVLVNNAAKAVPIPVSIMDHSVDDVFETLETNTMSTFHMMRLCFPYLKQSRGSIINYSSMSCRLGLPGYSAYSMSKGAVQALTLTAAREWGEYGINVNIIEPAAFTDQMASLDRSANLVDPFVIKANKFIEAAITPALSRQDSGQPSSPHSGHSEPATTALMANAEVGRLESMALGDPYHDIAPVVVFLSSEDARYLTGQSIAVDGGRTIHL